MANREFKIQSTSLSLNGVALDVSANGKIVIPGITRASSSVAIEVEDTADQTITWVDIPVVIDGYTFAVLNGDVMAQEGWTAAAYSVDALDGEGYIDGITVDDGGAGYTGEAVTYSEVMYAAVAGTTTDPFNAGDWIQIPFRVRCGAGDIQSDLPGAGGDRLTSPSGDYEVTLDNNGVLNVVNTDQGNGGGGGIWFGYGYIDQDNSVDGDALRISGGDGVTIKAAEDQTTWRFNSDGTISFPDGSTQSTAYTGMTSSNIFVCANKDGNIITSSDDGLTWNGPYNTGYNNLGKLAIGNGLIIFTRSDQEDDGANSGLWSTTDPTIPVALITGTDSWIGGDLYWNEIKYFASAPYKWVAVGYSNAGGDLSPVYAYSNNGANFVLADIANLVTVTGGADSKFNDVDYNGTGYFFVGEINGQTDKGLAFYVTDLTQQVDANTQYIDTKMPMGSIEYLPTSVAWGPVWVGFDYAGHRLQIPYAQGNDPTQINWTTDLWDETSAWQSVVGYVPGWSDTTGGSALGASFFVAATTDGQIMYWPNLPEGPYISIPKPFVSNVNDVVRGTTTTIVFTGNGPKGDGEKITIAGVTSFDASEPGTSQQDYNGTYYIKTIPGGGGPDVYELYTDQALTLPWDTTTFWPPTLDTGTITWSHGQYIDAIGYGNGIFICSNDNEEVFRSEDGGATWTQIDSFSGAYMNDVDYGSIGGTAIGVATSLLTANGSLIEQKDEEGLVIWGTDVGNDAEYVALWYGGDYDNDDPIISITAGTYNWATDDGDLQNLNYPDNGQRQINMDIKRTSDDAIINWHFDEDGNLYLPAQPDLVGTTGIVFADGTTQTTASGNGAQLIGDGAEPGVGFKRTITVNYEGYQGGESTTVWINPADAVGINNGDTITFRNGDVRTITGQVDSGNYWQLEWNGAISTDEFEPAYPLTITTANYIPDVKSTARIIPDSSTQGSGQFMDVYVGGSQVLDNKHVHMAGHTVDTEVFLGTDNNFVSAKDAGGGPARVNLQSENDITVTNTNLRMNQGSSFASIYGDGENRNMHGSTYDLTWNVITSDDQGNYYVGGEAASYSEAMISKYGPNGELVWKRVVNGDNTYAGKVNGVAYNPDADEVAFAVGTGWNRSQNYHKLEVFDAKTGEHKSSTDVYDNDAYFSVHEMVYHPTLGYVMAGDTHGEQVSTNTITSQGGTATGIIELPIADCAINGIYPKNSENWYIYGTNFSPNGAYLYGAVGIYKNLPVTTVTGGGAGATLTFRLDYNTMGYYFWSAGDQLGSGYNNGDELKIPGSLVGGVDGVNDITFKANSSTGLNDIYDVAGTPNPQYLRIDAEFYMGYNGIDFSNGTYTFKYWEDTRGFVWTSGWSKYYQPANFSLPYVNSFARAVAVDQYDNGVVVGGYDGNENKGFLWKLDSAGNTLWVTGVEQDNQTVSSIAVSKTNGAIYFATEWNSVNKFTHAGGLIKRISSDGPWGHSIPQVALQQELDGEEYLYVGGRFGSAWSNNSGFMLNKLDSNLVPIWSRDLWNDNQEINISYDIPHRDFALGRNNAVLVGYGYPMSYDYTNGILLGISTDDDFDNVSSDGWNLQNPSRYVRYIDITSSNNTYDFLDNGATITNTSLSVQDDTDSLDWTKWSWKSSIVNLNSMNHGIVGVQCIEFADGGRLDHNPGDIPQSPTDFYQNGWNYTLQPRDRGRFIINQPRPNDSYASNLYITVPRNSNTYFPVGSVITLINTSSADANGYRIYVQPEGYGDNDAPKIWATGGNQNPSTWSFQGIQTATLMKIGSNEWLLTANDITNED